jgi:hypothetical protein
MSEVLSNSQENADSKKQELLRGSLEFIVNAESGP